MLLSRNNLATINTNDFTVTQSGDAFISQTKVAELCGVVPHAISQQVVKTRDTLKLNEINQLHYESLELMIGHYAFDSQRTNDTARSNYRLLAKAGAKAYIYHEAGYTLSAIPEPIPLTPIEMARLNLELVIKAEEAMQAKIDCEKACILRLSKIGNHLAGSTISQLENNMTFNTAAKVLSSNLNIKLGHNSLMKLCREHGWLMTGCRSPSEKNMPTESKIRYFKIKLFYNDDTGIVSVTPVLSAEGIVKLAKEIPVWYGQKHKLIQF